MAALLWMPFSLAHTECALSFTTCAEAIIDACNICHDNHACTTVISYGTMSYLDISRPIDVQTMDFNSSTFNFPIATASALNKRAPGARF